MSDKIDVLTAIDVAIEGIHGEGYECSYLEQARAAVAELITSGVRLTAAFRALGESRDINTQSKRHRECENAMVAFDSAIARVRGE